jgi:hypothetical protein
VTDKPTPELAVRLLRAKIGELENIFLHQTSWYTPHDAAGDLAFIAALLADAIERMGGQ